MRVDLFDFDLPPERIALRPAKPRDTARMLVVTPPDSVTDGAVRDLAAFLQPGDALVVNDTRVIPARLHGIRVRGKAVARIEATLVKREGDSRWRAMAKPAKRLAVGERIRFGDERESGACSMTSLDASLGLDEDLAEAVALAHDLGHTPFGHTGEEVLDRLMAAHGGFDHNAQTLRIVTKLERRYAAFDGLNLTFETVEGLAKHNGPLRDAQGTPVEAYRAHGIPGIFLEEDAARPLGLERYASAEAQTAALADDIAYNAHDLDDGLRAGLFTLEDCRAVSFLAGLIDEIGRLYPNLDESRRIHELTRRLITRFVEDVTAESRRRLRGVESIEAVRDQPRAVVAFSPAVAAAEAEVKRFLFGHMYHQRQMMRIREGAASVVADLFSLFRAKPEAMVGDWAAASAAAAVGADAESRRARIVCDYIAGMTDRFALAEHRRHFDATPELRYGARR